jgi:hypothetical protein
MMAFHPYLYDDTPVAGAAQSPQALTDVPNQTGWTQYG